MQLRRNVTSRTTRTVNKNRRASPFAGRRDRSSGDYRHDDDDDDREAVPSSYVSPGLGPASFCDPGIAS